jgi:hypothetical protein
MKLFFELQIFLFFLFYSLFYCSGNKLDYKK